MKKALFMLFFLVSLFIFSGAISASAEDKKKIIKEEVTVEEESSESRASSVVGGERTTAEKKPAAVKSPKPKKPKIKPKVSVSKKETKKKSSIASASQKKYKKKTTKKVWEEEVEESKTNPCEDARLVVTSFSTTGPKKEKEKDQVEIFGIAKIPKDGKVSIEFRSGVSDFAPLAELDVKAGMVTQLHAPTTPLTIGNWYGARIAGKFGGALCFSKEEPFRIFPKAPVYVYKEEPLYFSAPSGERSFSGGGGYFSTTRIRHEYKSPTQPATPPAPSVPLAPSGGPGPNPPAHR